MRPKPIGIMIWANHRGILGAMSIGYCISTFNNSQLPHVNATKTRKVVTFAIHFPK